MKILGLIPARGGSKGIPLKNQKELLGKPLLQYTIEAALGSEMLDSVVFSSEDPSLIDLAKKMGAEVPFVRPGHLATDTASSIEVVEHALEALSAMGRNYDAVCLLQVTNPFRTSQFIDKAILKFKEAGTDSLVSVLKVPHEFNPHWVYEVSEKDTLKVATEEDEVIKRRQDLPTAYYRDGSIYVTKSDVVTSQHSLYGKEISYIESDPERHVNIDTMQDWKKAVVLAEKLAKKRIN
jgi:CMP-N,N'-diacetyllegionaminic acid synthase